MLLRGSCLTGLYAEQQAEQKTQTHQLLEANMQQILFVRSSLIFLCGAVSFNSRVSFFSDSLEEHFSILVTNRPFKKQNKQCVRSTFNVKKHKLLRICEVKGKFGMLFKKYSTINIMQLSSQIQYPTTDGDIYRKIHLICVYGEH